MADPAISPAPLQPGGLRRLWDSQFRLRAHDLAGYLLRTEVHTYAFSVAANAILSFVPFVVMMLWLALRVFHSKPMYEAIQQIVQTELPANQEFITRSLRAIAAGHKKVQIFSLVMLLISSTGVFLPLEVALNRVWGFAKDRSYWLNQIVSLALALGCGVLAMASVALTARNRTWLATLFGSDQGITFQIAAFVVMKAAALVASILIFFLIYWLLPHGRVRARAVFPAAVVTGFCWELAKYLYQFALPWLDFQKVYGPFALAVTLLVWAFISGLLLLAGAHLSAAGQGAAHSGGTKTHRETRIE
jgi:membrane protein